MREISARQRSCRPPRRTSTASRTTGTGRAMPPGSPTGRPISRRSACVLGAALSSLIALVLNDGLGPLAAVDGRLDDGQPHADGAYLFWALGMLVLGLWGPETKDVPMERMEELFGGPWWRKTWSVRVDLAAAAAAPPGSSSSMKDSMEKARHSEPAERV
ncbi:hypothetical protein DL770_001051 [Monosporascus sp. CRB-9-2]|nr:hypothetical protein DL770_001051 [Monosporascus sp. CRB-9-2]